MSRTALSIDVSFLRQVQVWGPENDRYAAVRTNVAVFANGEREATKRQAEDLEAMM